MNVQNKRSAAPPACARCAESPDAPFNVPLAMAFQPIVSVSKRDIFAQEALVRGPAGEGAATVFAAVTDETLYSFDQECRVAAIAHAAAAGIATPISINFLPNAVYKPETCIRRTLWAADKYDFPLDKIIFELTEHEQIGDMEHVKGIIAEYQRQGFRTAIDDFGAGFAGLGLLAELQPDIIKIDRALVSGIDHDPVRQAIVDGILTVCDGLGIEVVAEGIEERGEVDQLSQMGIDLMQGFYFAEPRLRAGWTREEILAF